MHSITRFFTLTALLLGISTFTSHAASIVAARLSLQESAVQTLSQISKSTAGVGLEKFHVKQIEFLLIGDANQTLRPVIFIKADPSGELGIIGMGAMFSVDFKQEGEWLVGEPKTGLPPATSGRPGDAEPRGIQGSELTELTALASQPSAYPFCFKAYPPIIVSALRRDKNLEKQMTAGCTAALLKELETLDSVEIRGLFNANTLRIVTILKPHADSALSAFLSQRLPNALPAEHSLMNASGAFAYGYSVYNSKAYTDYLAHLAALFKTSVPEVSQKLENLGVLSSPAGGYSGFVMHSQDDAMPYVYTKGFWTPTSAPEMIKAQLDLTNEQLKMLSPMLGSVNAAAFHQNNFVVKSTFKIGELPVWKVSCNLPENATGSQKKTAASMTCFYALRDGSLLSAPNAETLAQFIQSFDNPGHGDTFDKTFTHYPTIYSQIKIDSDAIVKSSQKTLAQPLYLPHCEPIYLAASIGLGQAAITFDIPARLFENMEAIANAAKPALLSAQKPAVKKPTVAPEATRH